MSPAVLAAPAIMVAPTESPARPAHTSAGTLPAQRPSARPEPTRAATLAAFRNALPAAAAPTSLAAAPALAPALAIARWPAPPPMTRPAPLARVESGASSHEGGAPQASRTPAVPDLDALADHVLERLRHELRDGRERLGYLLDDLR